MLRAIAQPGDSAVATSPVAAPPVTRDDADRRQPTVIFCDLVGSTTLATRFDPEDMRKIIGACYRVCTDVIVAGGSLIAKYLGDGVLAYFGYPQAHEDDAERAVSLRVRIGIAPGVVVDGGLTAEGEAQERGVVGETPTLAARLQTLPGPEQW